MVVEDEPALNEAITLKLRKEGIVVLPLGSAEDALVMLETKKPDLIWLDILLPGMDGLAFLRQMRSTPKLQHLRVVVVSVSAGDEKIKQAFGLNVLDYIVKSQYPIDEIVKKIKYLLDHEQKV